MGKRDKINIAFVGPLPPPLGGIGVMNQSFQQIVKEKWNVLEYNTSNGKLNEDLYKKKNLKNLFNLIRTIPGFFKFICKNKFKVVNIFVTSNIAFVRDSVLILLLWICRKRIIIHFHSKKTGEFFLQPFTIKYVSFIFKFAKRIIVLSEDHFYYFSKYFNSSKMTIIENFVDYNLFDCKIENKKKEFLYVGRLSQKKGFFDLIEAIKILTEKEIYPKINVLGTPENENTKTIIDTKLKSYNLEQNIILHGNVQGSRKYNFFKNCSIFIFPSHFENSPVVLKEAIASKMAIISSDLEANTTLLANKENTKFFTTGNSVDLSNKIEELLMDSSLTNDYMLHSQKCELYDKKFAAEKINNLFVELLN